MKALKIKLEILAPAQRELEEIALVHLELAGSNAARKITNRIYNALELLTQYPGMGVSCKDKPLKLQDYRMLVCGYYLCVYRLIGDTVFVYHIADSRSDYPKLMKLTENGYTADFEAELLAASREADDAVANGAKTYKSAAELRAALDAEEDNER